MKKAKIVSMILSLCMVLSVFMIGIVSVSAAEEEENIFEGTANAVGATITDSTGDGKWEFAPESYINYSDGSATDLVLAIKAINDSKYSKYTIIQIIATKEVSGTNKLDYVFLCYRTNKDERTISLVGQQPNWVVVTVKYAKTSQTYLTDHSEDIDIADVKTTDNPSTDWSSTAKTPDANALANIPNAVSTALTSYSDQKLDMIAQLGTQNLDGTNRRFLCYGTKDSKTNLYVVDVHEKDDQAQVTRVACFDLSAYVPATSLIDEANKIEDKTKEQNEQNAAGGQQSANSNVKVDTSTTSPQTGYNGMDFMLVFLIIVSSVVVCVSVKQLAKKKH